MKALLAVTAVFVAATVLWPRRRHRRRSARFGGVATAWHLRDRDGSLALGRWATAGWVATPLRLGAAPGSLLVVGPTQSGKTTALCAPIVSAWRGPVLAASVKGDLADRTAAARRSLGRVQVVSPGAPGGAVFDPVALSSTYEAARTVARDLTVGTGAGVGEADQAFWATLAAKLLAPLLLAANRTGGSVATVAGWVDRRDGASALDVLDGPAADALVASLARDDRTLGSVLATVEAALEPMCAGDDVVIPAALLDGCHTCYLSAPLHDQPRFRPMFAGLLRAVLAEAASRAALATPVRLLVLLDEAASIAPVDELDQVAATCQGLGVTLVTVWQDLAQLVARYGPRARTVVNNHTARVLLGGLADPTLAEWLPTLTGPGGVASGRGASAVVSEEVRQLPRGAAVYVAGRYPPVRLRLRNARPWPRCVTSLRFGAWRAPSPCASTSAPPRSRAGSSTHGASSSANA